MPRTNDNWERLVAATLDREKLREIALADSRETSFRSSISSTSTSRFKSEFNSPLYIAPGTYLVPVHLADRVIKAAEAPAFFKQECMELRHKTQQLESLLKQVEYVSDILYNLPTSRIMDNTQSVLHQALVLVTQCQEGSLWRRLFTKISVASFRTMSSQLEHSIRNVSRLLRDDNYSLGLLPPIATDEPILYHTWQLIAILHTGSVQDRCNAAASLLSDDHLDLQLIVEEDGVGLLLKLLKEGTIQGQENATRALGVLLKYPKTIEDMIIYKIWEQFCGLLEEGPMNVQSAVARVISKIVENGHLVFFLEAAVSDFLTNNGKYGTTEKEEPVRKAYIYSVAARTLRHLVKSGNYSILRSIVNSSAVSDLAVLLEKGPKESRYIFIMVLMEITEIAQNYALIRPCLRFDSFARKAIVHLLFRVTENSNSGKKSGMVDSDLLLPSIKIIGNLSQSFGGTEIRMISPLVKLLHHKQKENISMEACITLVKLVSYDQLLCVVYCKEIIIANGVEYLVRLVHFGDEIAEVHALILLCYITLHFPQSKELVDARVHSVFSWALKHHEPFEQNKVDARVLSVLSDVKRLLPSAVRITVPDDLADTTK